MKNTFHAWVDHDPFRQSAVIAYYAIFSLPALLVIVIALAGFAFGADAVTGQLSSQIGNMMGQDTAKQIQDMVAHASISNKSLLASILAVITLLIGSTVVFAQLQKSLNRIWEVKPSAQKAFWQFIKTRLLSFGLILSIGFLLIISLLVSTILQLVNDWFTQHLPGLAVVILQATNFIASFIIITILFALIFKVLPDVQIKWKDVWMGSIVTSLLFSAGKFLLGFYFSKAHPSSSYGAAGSVILIMLWVFYSCMILYFGAEFTREHAKLKGKKIRPLGIAEKDPEAQIKLK